MKKSTRYLLITSAVIFMNHGLFANSNNPLTAQASLKVYPSKGDMLSPKHVTQSRDNKINGEVPPGKIGGANEVMQWMACIDLYPKSVESPD